MRSRIVLGRVLRSRETVAGLVLFALLLGLAFIGPYFSLWDWTEKDFENFLAPPSDLHPFGTTSIGGDVFAITLRGLQKSILIGLLVGVISSTLAAVVGGFAGYFGGWVERILMWGTDLLLVLPSFLIIAILAPRLKTASWLWLVVLLAVFSWMVTGRVVRAMTLSLREREYVQAAVYMGASAPKVLFKHVMPNVSSLLIIDVTLGVGLAILAETGLSFFGFGVQPPDVSLGTLIADGTYKATTHTWLFAFPAGMLLLLVLAINLIGDGLRDAIDPGSTT
ncbi:ABC transporter permease [Nonomuraea sp. NPDC050556]|uniref:ABC transporter permease n=1 Tax=Nonomuraea sp. NPDC050556 TaxID=3364369 RepID=UPI0037BB3E95